jgi:hypothetical protein
MMAFSPWNLKCANCNVKIKPNYFSVTIFLVLILAAAFFGWNRRTLNLSWPYFIFLLIVFAAFAEYTMYRLCIKYGTSKG